MEHFYAKKCRPAIFSNKNPEFGGNRKPSGQSERKGNVVRKKYITIEKTHTRSTAVPMLLTMNYNIGEGSCAIAPTHLLEG